MTDNTEALPPLEQMRQALEHAKAGLLWYQDRYPEVTDGSDDEAMELIDAALALPAALAQRQQAAPSAQAERRVECDACPTALGCLGKCMKVVPPAAQAEPVKWQARLKDEPGAEWWDCSAEWARLIIEGKGSFALLETRPLYAAPPAAHAEPQVPLTREQALEVIGNVSNIGDALRILRATEAAHGIGKQEGK